MKNRLQLVKALMEGSATEEEKRQASDFPIIAQEVKRQRAIQTTTKRKAVKIGR